LLLPSQIKNAPRCPVKTREFTQLRYKIQSRTNCSLETQERSMQTFMQLLLHQTGVLFSLFSSLATPVFVSAAVCDLQLAWILDWSNQVPSCDRWEPKRRRRTTAADGAFLVRRRLCSHFWESCSGAAPRCRTRRCSAADTTQVMAVWRLGGLFCVGEGSENRPFRIWDPRPRLKAEPTGRKSGRVYIQTLPLRKDKWWFFFPLPCIDKDKSW